MGTWSKTKHDFGSILTGSTQRCQIEYTGSKEVLEIEPLCNCVGYTFRDKILTLTWKVRKNIVQPYLSTKVVAIVYKDQSIDDITLTGYITNEI